MQSEIVQTTKTTKRRKVVFVGCPSVGTNSTTPDIVNIHFGDNIRANLTREDAEWLMKTLSWYVNPTENNTVKK